MYSIILGTYNLKIEDTNINKFVLDHPKADLFYSISENELRFGSYSEKFIVNPYTPLKLKFKLEDILVDGAAVTEESLDSSLGPFLYGSQGLDGDSSGEDSIAGTERVLDAVETSVDGITEEGVQSVSLLFIGDNGTLNNSITVPTGMQFKFSPNKGEDTVGSISYTVPTTGEARVLITYVR